MARPLRIEYPDAVYHVMARGDGGKFIFNDNTDAQLFLKWLSQVCQSHGWKVHAWVLMGNHFHLLLETPEANLVSGMKLFLGAFAQAWNRRYQRRGHVFQGRYKSIPVFGEMASDEAQFRTVADYIHLNPARAKLAGGRKGPLLEYPWSSLKHYARNRGPSWLVQERVLKAFQLSQNGRGRRAYVHYLEERARVNRGELPQEAMKALRRGWYLGDLSFRDKLLAIADPQNRSKRKKTSHTPEVKQSHDEAQAEKLIERGLKYFDLSLSRNTQNIRKGDFRKVAIATLLKKHTGVTNRWIATQLQMGHENSINRLIRNATKDLKTQAEIRKLETGNWKLETGKIVYMRGLT